MKLASVVSALRKHYGKPAPPLTRDPFELVLLENAAYLVDDSRRATTWEALRDGSSASTSSTPRPTARCRRRSRAT
jgi:hypothetical protein